MPARKTNQIGRIAAILALLAAFALVAAVITGGELTGGSGDKGGKAGKAQTSPEVRRALRRGVYVVKPGDTLVGISAKLGIDADQLLAVNQDLDPQILSAGQRIRLP